MNLEKVTELRHIALCSVLYKVFSKVLANRLKSFLPHIISESQSAFILGRHISDNNLVSFEILNHLRSKKKGKKGVMALKIDMSKAYDRIEWRFLKAIMIKMRFDQKYVKLILACTSTISYLVVTSGHSIPLRSPTRGLKQGTQSPHISSSSARRASRLCSGPMRGGAWFTK